MDVRTELTDPATLVVAGVLGGLAGAVVAARAAPAGGLAAAVLVAALVLGAKLAAVAVMAGAGAGAGGHREPAPAGPVGAAGEAVDWLGRATDAVAIVRRRAVLITDPLLVDAADDLVGVATRVLDALYRHAGLVVRSGGTAGADEVARAALGGMEAGVPALADVAARLSSPAPPSLVTLVDDLRTVADHLARTEAEARRARRPPPR